MSLSPECIQQHDRETARVRKILALAALGSLGIHGLAWAVSAILPAQVIAEESAPIELLLISEPEEPEPPEPLAQPELELEPENLELSERTESSSSFLTAAAQLAPASPALPEATVPEMSLPEMAVPEAIAAAPPLPEPTILLEPEPVEPNEVAENSAVEEETALEELPEVEDLAEADELAKAPQEIEDVAETAVAEEAETVEEVEVADAIASEPAPEADSPSNKPSLLDQLKDLQARARQGRETQQAANSARGNGPESVSPASSSTAVASSTPQNTRGTGQLGSSPGSSQTGSGKKQPPSPGGGETGIGPIAASEPTSQGSEPGPGENDQPGRQTIACKRCSKPKFSKGELEGAEGETQFEVITDARGRVVDVVVISTSGSAAVDAKTVAHIKRNWRFEGTAGGATVPVTVDMAVEGSDYYAIAKRPNLRNAWNTNCP
ncbi:MAG: hypothetical protein HC824_14335, partial [Synechococcales cyanobacterium RM1_1_8]|nr:hypothetical protein [Synechococcales cyanobacterium RM1_1_8]